MNKNKMLLLLAIPVIMASCGNREEKAKITSRESGKEMPLTDTLFVVGTLDQPNASDNGATKYLHCINKRGYEMSFGVPLNDGITIRNCYRDPVVSYIERGDTIVIQDGIIVKNITMDNMIKHYVNGR